MLTQLLRLSLTCSAVIALSSCYVPRQQKPEDRLSGGAGMGQEEPSPEAARPLPWELWPHFKTLSGQPLTSRDLLYGDELRGWLTARGVEVRVLFADWSLGGANEGRIGSELPRQRAISGVERLQPSRPREDEQKHGNQHEGRRDHRETHLPRAEERSDQRALPSPDTAVDVLEHHDRVVDHEADRQHQREQRKEID